MFHLHETETPVMLEGASLPVGYRVETPDFSFTAIYETDGSVNVFVEWGDDQSGDMVGYDTMSEAKRWLDTLLESVKKKEEATKVKINLTVAVNESVTEGLKKVGLPDTPHNRIEALNGMHKKLLSERNIAPGIQPILSTIEDEVSRLQGTTV